MLCGLCGIADCQHPKKPLRERITRALADRDEDVVPVTAGDMRRIGAVLDALVDYVEAREWLSVTLRNGIVVDSCESCDGLRKYDQHVDGCQWLALMRAAGRR